MWHFKQTNYIELFARHVWQTSFYLDYYGYLLRRRLQMLKELVASLYMAHLLKDTSPQLESLQDISTRSWLVWLFLLKRSHFILSAKIFHDLQSLFWPASCFLVNTLFIQLTTVVLIYSHIPVHNPSGIRGIFFRGGKITFPKFFPAGMKAFSSRKFPFW